MIIVSFLAAVVGPRANKKAADRSSLRLVIDSLFQEIASRPGLVK
jgi:hypothetical protein